MLVPGSTDNFKLEEHYLCLLYFLIAFRIAQVAQPMQFKQAGQLGHNGQ